MLGMEPGLTTTTIFPASPSLGPRCILLAVAVGLLMTALRWLFHSTAHAQTPPPVNFISGELFSGVGLRRFPGQ